MANRIPFAIGWLGISSLPLVYVAVCHEFGIRLDLLRLSGLMVYLLSWLANVVFIWRVEFPVAFKLWLVFLSLFTPLCFLFLVVFFLFLFGLAEAT